MIRTGTATLATGGGSAPGTVTVNLGAAFASGIAVCQYAQEAALNGSTQAGTELKGFVNGSGALTITTRSNTNATIPVSYIVYAAALTN